MKTKVFIATLLFLTTFGIANAEILFVDDFEQDDIGKEPSRWEHLNFNSGNSKITIEKDPADPGNKAAKTTGIGLYIPKVDGREEWRDYIWDFDWLWENDSFVGTIYRAEGGLKGAESHFHGTRRTGGSNIQIYTRKAGAWSSGWNRTVSQREQRMVYPSTGYERWATSNVSEETGGRITARGLASSGKACCGS